MAIFAVPLETQVRKPSDATLRAKDSAAFIHEAEDLVVFSPRLYKRSVSSDAFCQKFTNKNEMKGTLKKTFTYRFK